MATSEIFYKGETKYIKDTALGMFIRLFRQQVEQINVSKSEAYSWIPSANEKWEETWSCMPPGLKDIFLDDFLTSQEKEKVFLDITDRIVAVYKSQYDNAYIAKEIGKFRDIIVNVNSLSDIPQVD